MNPNGATQSAAGDENSLSGLKLFALYIGALVLFALRALGLGEVVVKAAYGTAVRYYDNYRSRPMIYNDRSYGRYLAHDFKDRLNSYQVYSMGPKKAAWTLTTNDEFVVSHVLQDALRLVYRSSFSCGHHIWMMTFRSISIRISFKENTYSV